MVSGCSKWYIKIFVFLKNENRREVHLLIEEYVCETVSEVLIKGINEFFLVMGHFKVWDGWGVDFSFVNREKSDFEEKSALLAQLKEKYLWVEDLQTDSFKTICDLVPILKSSYTSRAKVPSLEDCFLFGFLKWPVSLKYLGGWPGLDLANLSDLWFLLVFLACVNLGPWLHANPWIQCPSWVYLPDLSSFSGLLSQQFPWLPNFVTWQLDLSLYTFQKGTTAMIDHLRGVRYTLEVVTSLHLSVILLSLTLLWDLN